VALKPEIAAHRQRCEADIDAVEIANDHAQAAERQQP
jgi:hypothetical protein